MREAMLLARLSALEGEVPVGAVVTRAGGIVGRGRNRRETGKNALAHAELEAIAEACQNTGRLAALGVHALRHTGALPDVHRGAHQCTNETRRIRRI